MYLTWVTGGSCGSTHGQRARSRLNAGLDLDADCRMALADLLQVCERAYDELPAEVQSIYSQAVAKLR